MKHSPMTLGDKKNLEQITQERKAFHAKSGIQPEEPGRRPLERLETKVPALCMTIRETLGGVERLPVTSAVTYLCPSEFPPWSSERTK